MIDLVLPWPPSVNTYWRHPNKGPLAGRTLISEKGREYRIAVQQLAMVERWGKMPADARLSVQIDAWPPDKRRRDLDNVLKASLDALAAAGVLEDDCLIDHLSIRRSPVGGMLKVRIAEVVA